jgi:hypothetical protein
VIVKRSFAIIVLNFKDALNGKTYLSMSSGGVSTMRKKNIMDWLRAIFSMVFYIGIFGGIGYLIQVVIL